MAERDFFLDQSRSRITEIIREVEAQTSAELVVTVRHVSGRYRDVDYLVGFAMALVTLGALLFLPVPFAVESMPVDVVVGFALGSFVSTHAPPLRRLLVTERRLHDEVARAARAAFVDRGISRTRGRNGILVFVSTFERTVEVLADIGIDTKALGPLWAAAVEAARDAVKGALDFGRFVDALRTLGPDLAAAMPHAPDDVDELPDEVEAHESRP